MSLNLSFPKFSLITVLCKRASHASRLIAIFEKVQALDVSVMRPEEMKSKVLDTLNAGRSAAFHLAHSHPKAIDNLARWAKLAGAELVIFRIGHDAQSVENPPKHLYQIDPCQIDEITIDYTSPPVDLSHRSGPFDIIGDVHGCADELRDLLVKLGHAKAHPDGFVELIEHPEGRQVCFVGDLTDRGPKNLAVMEIAYQLNRNFDALVVVGNHDFKIQRWLNGATVNQSFGMQMTIAELEALSTAQRGRYSDWFNELKTHYVLDSGRLVIAHAGLAERHHGRISQEAISFAMYGEKSGQVDIDGIDIIRDWAIDYRGAATVVHGHVVTDKPRRMNKVISIDTGCVYGGQLTALRYPENTFVSVDAHRAYAKHKPRVLATS